ncbi:hypothetical protein [Neopusillimonas aromaticivorans]|uniref:hypothetical protein n=1 Tax=Neopusillimonas aromaticivorans TaxID=2979868 RepID=UPI0025991BCB|nr:hypothetical protein [Neopusillimonas aromaticivorans]WJJ93643.1 hypothetical protein N7E01_17475 [Neopusillimonas aromaticivorans]
MRHLTGQHKQEVMAMQQELGIARHDNGKLEGELSAATQRLEQALNQAASLQDQLHQANSRTAVLQLRLEGIREQVRAGQRQKSAVPTPGHCFPDMRPKPKIRPDQMAVPPLNRGFMVWARSQSVAARVGQP